MKIVFVDPTSCNKPYNGNSLKEQGMGASWTSVIHLAREFVRLGHDVMVLNHCNKPGVYNGVKYPVSKIPEDLNRLEIKKMLQGTDALIVNRAGNIEYFDILDRFAGVKNYRKYLWCMDSGGAENGQPANFAKYDKVVSISQWLNQINIDANWAISPDYFTSITLGVDTNLFTPSDDANRFDVVFTGAVVSARRPQLAVDAFVMARKMRPDLPLKLHFIGSAAIWGGPAGGTSKEMQNVMADALRRAGPYTNDIIQYGDIPSEELAKILPKMGMMAYPTITETCGVTLLEAQAAGVPVIVPEDAMFSAVRERVYHTETGIVRSWSRMEEVGAAIIDMATNNYVYNKVRNNARAKVVRDNSWPIIAKRWDREILNGRSAITIQEERAKMKNRTVGIGVLSFQNRPLLERCINSLVQNADQPTRIVVWDNGSKGFGCDNVDWLRANYPEIMVLESPTNQHCTISRNGVIEYFRTKHPEIEYMLFSDMDVIFKPGFLFPMVQVMEDHPDCGIVADAQANCGFRPDDDGRVSEVMSICNLHRLKSFDTFPNPNRPFDETFKVYSFDSWMCQMLNMAGWYTYLVMGRKAYDHIGGQIGQFLAESERIKREDVEYWQSIANKLSFKKRWEDKNAADYVVIGNTLKDENKLIESEREYLEGISRYPDNATLFLCLGNLHKDKKEWNRALDAYKNLLRLNPKELNAVYAMDEIKTIQKNEKINQ